MKELLKNDVIFSLTVIVGALLVSAVIYLIVSFILRGLRLTTANGRLKIMPTALRPPLRSLIPAVIFLGVQPMLRLAAQWEELTLAVAKVWLIASIGWFLIQIVNVVKASLLNLYDVDARDNLKARQVYTQIKVIENIVDALIIFLTLSFILLSFPGVSKIGTSLLASAGIAGVVLGFAAQKTLGNFIAGIQIAFAQPIRLDDVVIVENEWGWIEEITLTFVVVRIWDLRRLVVPISYFVEKPFQSWTRVSADILGSVFLYTDYTVPVGKIREELTRLLEGNPRWDKKVNCLQVTDAKEHTIELRALMSAADSPTAWDLRCEVREKLLTFLQKNFPESLPKTRVELEPSKSAK